VWRERVDDLPANTVHVILSSKREGNVNDELDVRDIETSGRNISRNENRDVAALESVQRLRALVLGQIAVNTANFETATSDELFNARGFFLVQAEDQDAVALVIY
jgi:hypothetical protein